MTTMSQCNKGTIRALYFAIVQCACKVLPRKKKLAPQNNSLVSTRWRLGAGTIIRLLLNSIYVNKIVTFTCSFFIDLKPCCLVQVRSDKKALGLLHQIIVTYQKVTGYWKTGTTMKRTNWKFFLAVTGILTNATMTNRSTGNNYLSKS